MSRVLVAGIGNIFLGDDGFGVEVVRRLAQRPLPANVKVADFGIRSYDLAYALMDDWALVILVDTLPLGEKPGTLCTFEPELPANGELPSAFDAHTMNPVAVLQLLSMLGGRVNRMLVVGCEPATLDLNEEGNIGMSAPVSAAIDEAVHIVEQLIRRARSEATAA